MDGKGSKLACHPELVSGSSSYYTKSIYKSLNISIGMKMQLLIFKIRKKTIAFAS